MTVKDLIKQLMDFPLNSEVRISDDILRSNGHGGVFSGTQYDIKYIQTFAGETEIVFDNWKNKETGELKGE